MKRILALVLAMATVLSLVACSNKESNTTTQENKTVEEVKKITINDIKGMTILEMARLEIEDVNHLSASELKIASKTFSEKKYAITEEELEEYINEFYLKAKPELTPLADDVMKIFHAFHLKQQDEQYVFNEEIYNSINPIFQNVINDYYETYGENNLKTAVELCPSYMTKEDYSAWVAGVIEIKYKVNPNPLWSYPNDQNLLNSINNFIDAIIETPVFFS